MKFLSTASLTACLLMSAQFAHADITDSCEKFKTSYDKTYCVAKLFLESDKELNVVYTDLKKPLKDDVKKELTQRHASRMSSFLIQKKRLASASAAANERNIVKQLQDGCDQPGHVGRRRCVQHGVDTALFRFC